MVKHFVFGLHNKVFSKIISSLLISDIVDQC